MAETPPNDTACYAYRHAVHRQVVHIADIADVRDAVATGRVAEALNFTIDDLLQGLAPQEVELWKADMEKGMAMVEAAAPPKPRTEPRPPRAPAKASGAPVRPLSTTPDPRLVQMRSKHQGEPAIIVASGPSLETPEARAGLDGLTVHRTEHDTPLVIGVNRARAVYPRCDYLAVMDHRLYTEHIADHAGWSHLFRGWEARMFVQDIAGWPQGSFVRVRPLKDHVGFSFDLTQGFHRGFTTTLLAMQVAVWLGCDPIYLAGLDLSYSAQGKTHFFGFIPWNRERDGTAAGKGLFSQMRATFEAVAPLLEARKIRVFNLNPQSAVQCFPFAEWSDMFTTPKPADGLTVGMEG